MAIDEVLRYLVEHVHFGSEANREEALEAVEKEFGKVKDEFDRKDKPVNASPVQQSEDK
jgi:hypothetical protein